MPFRIITIAVLLFFQSFMSYGQSTIEDLVQSGIVYHDNGDYDLAIETYKKALLLDSLSPLVNYEISVSYLSKKDYEQAINYADVVLASGGELLLQAYVTKGTALDMLNRTDESIEVFKRAIEETEGYYLLEYNLALNYFKINNIDSAEKYVIRAIEKNTGHSSSHLMLANICASRNEPIKSVLAAHYFLFTEPDSERSNDAYELIKQGWNNGVKKDPTKSNTINLTMKSGGDDRFASVELLMSLMVANELSKKEESKSDEDVFQERTRAVFGLLGPVTEKGEDIWSLLYAPFFSDLVNSDHLQTYCHYISQGWSENSYLWLQSNDELLAAFGAWLQEE